MMQQRQMQVSKAEATKIQSDITVLTPAVEALEKAVGQLKSQVSSHINSLKN
jgi:polyhydroxyalkanoate synthesis regulator phasin